MSPILDHPIVSILLLGFDTFKLGSGYRLYTCGS